MSSFSLACSHVGVHRHFHMHTLHLRTNIRMYMDWPGSGGAHALDCGSSSEEIVNQ